MLSLYTGTPGSFKSFHALKKIYYILKYTNKRIITNMLLNEKVLLIYRNKHRITTLRNSEITYDFFIDYAYRYHTKGAESQTLLVIDEAQILFSPNSVKLMCQEDKYYRQNWLDFFSQHRHYGYDIILITQYDKLIDAQIRVMSEYEYRHRCVNNYKFGMLLSLFAVKSFVVIQYWTGINEKCSVEFNIFSKKIAQLYDSYSRFEKKETKEIIESDTLDFAERGASVAKSAIRRNCEWSLLRQATIICNHKDLLTYRI